MTDPPRLPLYEVRLQLLPVDELHRPLPSQPGMILSGVARIGIDIEYSLMSNDYTHTLRWQSPFNMRYLRWSVYEGGKKNGL